MHAIEQADVALTGLTRRRLLRRAIVMPAGLALTIGLAACSSATPATAPAAQTSAPVAPTLAPAAQTTAPASAAAPTSVASTVTSAPTSAPAATTADTITYGSTVNDDTVNPLQNQDHTVNYAVFDALTIIDPTTHQATPRLALSWSRPTDTTIEFKLRPGVLFSNGTPLTATDVKFSFDTTLNEKLSVAGILGTIQSVDVVDPATVRLTTVAPDPIIDKRVALQAIVPSDYYTQQGGTKGFGQKPIGTGRYVIDSFTPDQLVTMKANPSAWQGPPASATVKLMEYSDTNAFLAAFQSGQIDVAQNLPAEAIQTLAGNSGFTVKPLPIGSPQVVAFNTTKPPFDNVQVRQAINMAVDVDAIIKTVMKGAATNLMSQVLGSDCVGYNPDVKPYAYDPTQAKAMLQAAGFGSGFQTEIGGLARDGDLMNAIAGFLQPLGISVTVTPLDFPVWVKGFQVGSDLPMFIKGINYSPLYDADVSYQWPTFSAAPAGSPKSWTDAMWDQLLQQERTTVDAAARLQILQHMGQYLRDQAPYLFLFNSQWVFGWTNKVQSFDTASAGFHMILDQAYKTA